MAPRTPAAPELTDESVLEHVRELRRRNAERERLANPGPAAAMPPAPVETPRSSQAVDPPAGITFSPAIRLPTVSTTDPPPVPPTAGQRREIQALLERYRQAIEARDVAQLRLVQPGLTDAEIRRLPADTGAGRRPTVAIEVRALGVANDRAWLEGVRHDTAWLDEGRLIRGQTRLVLSLKRTPTGWVIDAVQ